MCVNEMHFVRKKISTGIAMSPPGHSTFQLLPMKVDYKLVLMVFCMFG